MNDTIENPCDFCGREHPDSTRLCHRCLKHLETDLRDTPQLLLEVAVNGITYDHIDKHASGYITFTPADVNQISLLDPRSGITRVLIAWARIVITGLGLQPLPDHKVDTLTRRHLGWLPWIATHPDAADYAHDVTHHTKQLRHAVNGHPRRIPLGGCPTVDEQATACTGLLTADPRTDLIRCPRCRTTWTMDTWELLGRAIGTA